MKSSDLNILSRRAQNLATAEATKTTLMLASQNQDHFKELHSSVSKLAHALLVEIKSNIPNSNPKGYLINQLFDLETKHKKLATESSKLSSESQKIIKSDTKSKQLSSITGAVGLGVSVASFGMALPLVALGSVYFAKSRKDSMLKKGGDLINEVNKNNALTLLKEIKDDITAMKNIHHQNNTKHQKINKLFNEIDEKISFLKKPENNLFITKCRQFKERQENILQNLLGKTSEESLSYLNSELIYLDEHQKNNRKQLKNSKIDLVVLKQEKKYIKELIDRIPKTNPNQILGFNELLGIHETVSTVIDFASSVLEVIGGVAQIFSS